VAIGIGGKLVQFKVYFPTLSLHAVKTLC